ncbi:MAG TPA: 1-deoxy-D-xylulose-5-phosphate reductoisomerase [Spirochaetota bacterium]|nr:1-deoxy-D-xylulose-5-phosphate reductoisomerase [Spirochaetota bacterium]
MKNISILGVTGSIGESTLKICKNYPNELNILGILTNKNIKALLDIIDCYKVEYAVVADEKSALDYFGASMKEYKGTKIFLGEEGLEKICSDSRCDTILNGISGKAGVIPSYKILSNGINLALANKESMVCAGKILKKIAKENNCKIIPVDSEHSAIFQLVEKFGKNNLSNIILTASGGPFLNLDKSKWSEISVKEALNHPTWKMGNKITIDSATMANKGLEVIEAYELFDIPYDKIKVLTHPQSLIHSMIECRDAEIYAQIGPKDMSLPIMNAIFYPEIKENNFNRLDFTKPLSLELIPVDFNKFKMLELAYYCGKKDGLYTTFYNSANEELVRLFLEEKIGFIDIERYFLEALNIFEKEKSRESLNMENIEKTDKKTLDIIKEIIKRRSPAES